MYRATYAQTPVWKCADLKLLDGGPFSTPQQQAFLCFLLKIE